MKTIGTMFSGFGGVDIGAMAAGLTPLWGIEYDADIADVARRNLGDHIITADILTMDPSTLEPVDVLHASPPCPNFSVAKTDGEETENDLALAAKVCEFITTLEPSVFTLENVYAYRKSQSWAMIEDALYGAGYWLHVDHANAADYGVPQSRRRMIVRAVRGGFVPYLPPKVERHIGWYEAIEDIIDTLPDSRFAPWQIERLPVELSGSLLMSNDSHTVSGADSHRFDEWPAWTLGTTNGPKMRAFLLGNGTRSEATDADEPADTVTSNSNQSGVRAMLFGNGPNATSGSPIFVDDDKPAQTVRTASGGRLQRATLTNGRVVAMTPRALARFQTFPDWYELPEKKTLAVRGIGNAVPPLLYQRLIEPLLIERTVSV